MASETGTAAETRTGTFSDWQAGVVAGIAGGVVMGVLVSLMNPPTLEVAIASLYGLAGSGIAGWTAHLSHSAIFGVVFAALVAQPSLRSYGERIGTGAAFGVGYGVVLWVVAAALVMPIWLSAVGSPASPPFPNFATPSLLWHVVYGGVLGAVYPVLAR
jgi:hypothetical protein